MATIYFCDCGACGLEAHDKKVGSIEEIEAFVEMMKANGFTAFKLKNANNVWIIET